MINIDHPNQITYWIIRNNNEYLRGKTNPDQVTTAGPMWSEHLVTTNEQEWENECVLLGLGKEDPTKDDIL
jgi:hypothetical protein